MKQLRKNIESTYSSTDGNIQTQVFSKPNTACQERAQTQAGATRNRNLYKRNASEYKPKIEPMSTRDSKYSTRDNFTKSGEKLKNFERNIKTASMTTLPKQEEEFEGVTIDPKKLQYFQKQSRSIFGRFLKNFNKESPITQNVNTNQSNEQKPNVFLARNFTQNTMNRLGTFYKFAFTMVEKDENKFLSNVISNQLTNQNNQLEPSGSLLVCDLWSQKQRRLCLEKSKLVKEKQIMEKYLYFQTKYKEEIKKKLMKKWTQLPKFQDDISPNQMSHTIIPSSKGDLPASRQMARHRSLAGEMDKLVQNIKKFQETNQEDLQYRLTQSQKYKTRVDQAKIFVQKRQIRRKYLRDFAMSFISIDYLLFNLNCSYHILEKWGICVAQTESLSNSGVSCRKLKVKN